MKKIIEEGKLDTKITTCGFCKCKFAFNISDIEEAKHEKRGDTCLITCPFCKATVKECTHVTKQEFFDLF